MNVQEHPAAERDRAFIRRTLDLARQGWGQTAPNPMVGAVVVQGGLVVGEGWHAEFGASHAEPVALAAAGARARGATLYVSLEPCAHHGRTPPCVDAILGAGVARVVAATNDPNPLAGGGAERLRAAGVEVTVGVEEAAARELNAAFLASHVMDRPWITLKLALSIDGALTDARRSSGWLTGHAARDAVHHLRAGVDAIGVGAGTVATDDPRLTVRTGRRPRVAPRRVVFDSRLETLPSAALFEQPFVAPVTVLATRGEVPDGTMREAALRAAGADVIVAGSLGDALRALRGHGVRSLLVEGGAGLAGALLEESLVDRLVIFQAPILLGRGAVGAFARAPATLVAGAHRLPVIARETFGDDLMTVYALTAL